MLAHSRSVELSQPKPLRTSHHLFQAYPGQMRWSPPSIPSEPTDFVDGLISMAGAGVPELKAGIMIHYYTANTDMKDRAFYNADGEMLIGPSSYRLITLCLISFLVPQLGRLDIQTECGLLEVFPGEICVIPRGFLMSVRLPDGPSRGYICEVRLFLPLRLPRSLSHNLPRSMTATTSSPTSVRLEPTASPTPVTSSTPSLPTRIARRTTR